MVARGKGIEELREQAQEFAGRLTTSVHAVAPDCDPFTAQAVAARFIVRQEPDTGVPLTVGGAVLLTLKVSYSCAWDRVGHYLAVDESKVKVYAGPQAAGEPLFRYEYLRRPSGKDQPGAHIHIHAHRDGIAHVMTKVGDSTVRAKRRAGSSDVPRMSELHFPVGGPRYRPCLEDVLEMLVCELGVDCDDRGRELLRDARERWRRDQIRTVVRDAPGEAVETLREMGFTIPPSDQAHTDNLARLREH